MSVAAPRGQKRGPTVLVTDARERAPPPQRPQIQRQGTRLISVDNVLQYASEIPSAQRRDITPTDSSRPKAHNRTPSGRHPLNPKLSGRGAALNTLTAQLSGATHLPTRSSKTSEKLVLLPETTEEADEKEEEDEEAPPNDAELRQRRMKLKRGRSDAERLPKSQRTADMQLARVTAYCTAQSYKLRSTAQFVRDQHGAKTKLYDDCLYCVYQLPLLGGSEGYRVRSSPVVKNPGGRSVLDEQIEANEQRQYRDGWLGESAEYSVRGNEYQAQVGTPPTDAEHEEQLSRENGDHVSTSHEDWRPEDTDYQRRRESSDSSNAMSFPSPQPTVSPYASTVAEVFIFSYGVAVLWNFSPNQEKDLLADLTFSSSTVLGGANGRAPAPTMLSQKAAALAPPSTGIPLMTRPLDESNFETEDFHFQYDNSIEKPRIFNDMITLRTSDHMIKLAMSHAIAQSTKLSFFEERMQRTMTEAQYVPRRLALEGRLGMTRHEVVGLVGRLFEGRVDVNLSSNMLDTPNFFWDSEPTLHPLYQAVREYLEIKPRIQVLNERCRVFLDLAEILSDSIADVKMTRITWIIIVLIVLSILVTCTEVFLRFGILASEKKHGDAAAAAWKAIASPREFPLLSPPKYLALHPIGAAPVIEDGEVKIAESGACLEYIIQIHGHGRLAVKPGEKNYAEYLYWWHFGNGTLQPAVFRAFMLKSAGLGEDNNYVVRMQNRSDQIYAFMEKRLGEATWLAGEEFTAADVMCVFSLTGMREFTQEDLSAYPKILEYLKRVSERSAYRKAMEKGDPDIDVGTLVKGPPPPLFKGFAEMRRGQ
ncbi:Sad1-interacting factor 3 [Saxophila tyrrhenica]|uniref:Sad1-interacting factor 3 n=1 Tax=Saxophila tyrrhenica TaxID=1690608 RepID=A0AAV9NY73_9PEZI|nr:Sad1-interacting factor 3 [Saxophila tyrrhenica]